MPYKRGSKTQHKFKKKVKPTLKPKSNGPDKLVYKGVKYRSQLEVFCAKALDEAGLKADYEKHRFTLQEKTECPNFIMEHKEYKDKSTGKKKKVFVPAENLVRAVTYKPDWVNESQRWIIETKGHRTEAFDLRLKLFKKYMVENNLTYDYYTPSNPQEVLQTIETIKSRL